MTSKTIKTSIVLSIVAAIILPTMAFSSVNANTTDDLVNFFDSTFKQEGAADRSVEDKMAVANNILNGEFTEYPYEEERQIAMDRGLSLTLQIQTATSPELKAHLEELLAEHELEMLKYGLISKVNLEGPDSEEWLEAMREANLQNKDQEHTHDSGKQSTIDPFGYVIAAILPDAFANPHVDDWHVNSEIKYFTNGFYASYHTTNTWDHANGSGYFWVYHNISLPSYIWSDNVDGTHIVSNFASGNPETPVTYNYMTIWDDVNNNLLEDCYVQKNYSIWHHSSKTVTYCSSAGQGIDGSDLVYSSVKVDQI